MKFTFTKLPLYHIVSQYVDILEELIIKRNTLKTAIDDLAIEYHLENDDDGRLPILAEILELRMKLTSLQNEIIDLQSSKLAMLKEDQINMLTDAILKSKKHNPNIW